MLRIVAVCILAAVLYGIVHDSVTTRVCLEYFTVFHPTIIRTESPTVLALLWGVMATWWVGLGLGVPLALVSRASPRPKLDVRDLLRPIGVLLAVMAVSSLILGLVGYNLALRGLVRPHPYWAALIAPERHAVFLADLFAHNAAYGVGAIGGLVVILWAWHERKRRALGASSHEDRHPSAR